MAQHFELCDTDGDGFISFSQFLRWVELCDVNPEDHVQVHSSAGSPDINILCNVKRTFTPCSVERKHKSR